MLAAEESTALCAYGAPGMSSQKTCTFLHTDGVACMPGCTTDAPVEVRTDWCEDVSHGSWCDGRPWKMDDLQHLLDLDMLSNRSIEVVLDGVQFEARQPRSVQAVFMVANDPDGGTAARALHLSFMQAFPSMPHDDFPLLVLNPDHPTAPFSVAPGVHSSLEAPRLGPPMFAPPSPPRPPPPPRYRQTR